MFQHSYAVISIVWINMFDEEIRTYPFVYHHDHFHVSVGTLLDKWKNSGDLYQYPYSHVLEILYCGNIHVLRINFP